MNVLIWNDKFLKLLILFFVYINTMNIKKNQKRFK